MPTYRAVQVSGPKAELELVERPIAEPGPGEARIKVQACGICHSDVFTVEGLFPGISYPRVPGHEIAGVIDALGEDTVPWRVGQRVGVGWYGGHCGHCDRCRRGDFVTCREARVPGIAYDGGYAEYMIAPVQALALIPDELSAVEAGPLLCAGITTYNALRHGGARAGDVVAILGIGGLGHLAVQFAVRMGFRTVAIARGTDKAELARKLAREMDDHKTVSVAKVYVPNEYTVYLASADREAFSSYESTLVAELSAYLEAHARGNGFSLVAPPTVLLETDGDLRPGDAGRIGTQSEARDDLGRDRRAPLLPVLPQVPAEEPVRGHPAVGRRRALAVAAHRHEKKHRRRQERQEDPDHPNPHQQRPGGDEEPAHQPAAARGAQGKGR